MTAKTGKSMDAKATTPGPTSRTYVIRGTKKDAPRSRRNKLTARHPAAVIANASAVGPHCIKCLNPREPRSFPICPRCEGSDAL